MNPVVKLQMRESQDVLQTVIARKVPAIMSYLSRDKWHVAKVILTDMIAQRLYVEGYRSGPRPHPINIRLDQPVGMSFKHMYGKYVFDTTVVGLEPSSDPASGGTIVLAAPETIGVVQRRSFFRVNVPESLTVEVVLWHRTFRQKIKDQPHKYCKGRLVDISAGGAQVVLPIEPEPPAENKPDFRKGQFIGLRFTPMPYETPLTFNAQIRNVLPTADHTGLCLGLQIVGLEASVEGRETLSRIAAVVEQYHQINQSGAKQQDMQTIAVPEPATSVLSFSTHQ